MSEFSGTHTVVTGGVGAIGSEIVRLLHEAGGTVSVIDSDELGLDRLSQEFRGSGRLHCICSALSSFGDARSAFQCLSSPLDAMLHLVGLFELDGLDSLDAQNWDRAISVNLTSVIAVVQCFLQHRRLSEVNRVVLFDSIASARGSSGHLAYSAAKGGVGGLMRTLARDLAPGVLVNSVSPGMVDSPMGRHVIDDRGNDLLKMIPMRRFARPSEIAPLAVFLVGPQNTYITGQTLHVNGGAHMT